MLCSCLFGLRQALLIQSIMFNLIKTYIFPIFLILNQSHLYIAFQQAILIIIYIIARNKIQTPMSQHNHNQERDISSSQDNCRCESCRNQEQFKNYQRQNPTHIYMYKHLKKRGVPPVKKELFNKETSLKAKYTTRKEELEKKLEPEKSAATPVKHKLIEVLKSKQVPSSSFFIDYHPVSHSQREKLPSKDVIPTINEQPRRIIQQLKYNGFQKQHRIKAESIKLVEISQNPENIPIRYSNSRSVSQASANHSHTESNGKEFKSLEKIKN